MSAHLLNCSFDWLLQPSNIAVPWQHTFISPFVHPRGPTIHSSTCRLVCIIGFDFSWGIYKQVLRFLINYGRCATPLFPLSHMHTGWFLHFLSTVFFQSACCVLKVCWLPSLSQTHTFTHIDTNIVCLSLCLCVSLSDGISFLDRLSD